MIAKILINKNNAIIKDTIEKLFNKYMCFHSVYYENSRIKYDTELIFNIKKLKYLTILSKALKDKDQSDYILFIENDEIVGFEKFKMKLKKIFRRD